MAWQIDASHSHIQFSVRHMMISKVRGSFEEYNGTVVFNETNPEASSVNVTIDASSINTRDGQRDGHLKSGDFLNVESYPSITFQSTKIEKTGTKTGKIYGNLTIRGVSKEVVLETEFVGKAKSPWGTTSAGFNASTSFNRKDWGLEWNQALETGGVLVGEEVKVDIEVELVYQEEQQAEAVAA
jgi:polyisoprenoid-binding protein YceI